MVYSVKCLFPKSAKKVQGCHFIAAHSTHCLVILSKESWLRLNQVKEIRLRNSANQTRKSDASLKFSPIIVPANGLILWIINNKRFSAYVDMTGSGEKLKGITALHEVIWIYIDCQPREVMNWIQVVIALNACWLKKIESLEISAKLLSVWLVLV